MGNSTVTDRSWRLEDLLNRVQYCILHGWQGLPEHLPSDLDIVVAPKELLLLERALLETKDIQLVNLLQYVTTGYYFVLIFQEENQIHFLPIDAITEYRAGGRVWFSVNELLAKRRKWKEFWVTAPEIEFKYLLVKKIVKQSIPNYAAKRLQELSKELGTQANKDVQHLLGRNWGSKVLEWLLRGDWEAVERHLGTLKRVLKWERFKQDPLNPFRYWLPEIKRFWQRWLYPTGLFVVVLGPDGAGKSTLIEHLKTNLARAFRRTNCFHLMPSLLRRRNDSGPVTAPHGKPPRSKLVSLLKLVYYFLDYAFGYWVKVRPKLVKSTLVLFDRYYDDLLVDPKRYRYGGPMWLVKWLQRLIPQPDLYFVLDVPVEKLRERKQEVEPEELQRQIKAYREFAFSKPNAVLLDGSQSVEEVVRQAQEVVLDYMHERYLKRRHLWFPEGKEGRLSWLSDILGLKVGLGSPTHAYLGLPDGRGYLLPLDNFTVFCQGLNLYPAQTRKARWGKIVLLALGKVKLATLGLSKVCLEEGNSSIFQTLRELFERKDLCFAVSLGTPGPHRKPVIQVMDLEGKILGFAKIGWNEVTKELVRHESKMLQFLHQQNFPFKVPRILYTYDDSNWNICVQEPPSPYSYTQSAPQSLCEDYINVLCAFADKGVRWEPLEETSFWNCIITRAQQIQSNYWHRMIARTMETIREQWRNRKVPLHLAHGDFTPWNAMLVDERLYLYDWEYAEEWAPAGYDLFHFLVRISWLVEKKKPKEIVDTILMKAYEKYKYWKRFGIGTNEVKKLFQLYLLYQMSACYTREFFHFSRLWILNQMLQNLIE